MSRTTTLMFPRLLFLIQKFVSMLKLS